MKKNPRRREDAVLRDVTQSCQPKRISHQPSQLVQDSFTPTVAVNGGSMASGLSAISLPDTGVNIFNLLPADQFVFGTSSYRLTSQGRMVRRYNMKMDDLKNDNSIVNGVTFMKAFLH